MTQIYVVVSQRNPLLDASGAPLAAFSDYPSALAYAQTIFKPTLGSKMSSRDLVFLVTLAPSPTASTSTASTAKTATATATGS